LRGEPPRPRQPLDWPKSLVDGDPLLAGQHSAIDDPSDCSMPGPALGVCVDIQVRLAAPRSRVKSSGLPLLTKPVSPRGSRALHAYLSITPGGVSGLGQRTLAPHGHGKRVRFGRYSAGDSRC
jgi:hypothetical protein